MSKKNNFFLTIDVEDWFSSSIDIFPEAESKRDFIPDSSVVTNTLKSLKLLKRTQNTATFFILAPVGKHYPDLIKEILQQGHEIGVHSYSHKLVYKMSPDEFEDDLKKSLDILYKITTSKIKGYRAPYWSITKKSLWAIDILRKNELTYDSSIFPIQRKLYGIPDAPTSPYQIQPGFWEFPPATYQLLGQNLPIAGGGYLRLMPYWILNNLIKNKLKNSTNENVFYFHPYELDPQDTNTKQSISSLKSLLYLLQQKAGRKNNPKKIERLLYEYSFSSIEKSDSFIN